MKSLLESSKKQPVFLADVHCHLTHEQFKKDLPMVIKRAKNVTIHCAGSCLSDNELVLDLAQQYPNIKASLGLYPWDAVALNEAQVDTCLDMIKRHIKEVVSIGEVGLDHHWGKAEADWEYQAWVFDKALELAESTNKPVVVHTRQAEAECLELMSHHSVKAIIHSYTGPMKLVPGFLEQGYYFSIPAVVVRSNSFQSLVKQVPVDRLFTETDAPFMAPIIGQRSEPINVKDGLKKIAELKGLTIKQAETALTKNYKELF
ncbi:MAG: TatD family hydrolase [Candidatus Nanoarchaeia archaeon]|jgi:TatD DNase family protein